MWKHLGRMEGQGEGEGGTLLIYSTHKLQSWNVYCAYKKKDESNIT